MANALGQRVDRREVLLRHVLKIVSVLFAITLWFYVLNSEPLEQESEMSLSFVTPRGLAIGNEVSKVVRVRMRGARAFMRDISFNKNQIVLDLSKKQYKKKKQFDVIINPSDIPLPFGVDILEVIPSRISIRLEKKIKKKLNIKPIFVGTVASELKLMNYELKPQNLMLSGPVEVMRGISRLKTLPIDMTKLEGEGSLKIGLEELDDRVELEKAKSLEFHYSIKPRKANLSLERVKIRFLSSRQGIIPDQKFVKLDVLAPEGMRIKSSDVEVIADIPENSKKRAKIELKATLPDGVHLLQIHPPYINVRLK